MASVSSNVETTDFNDSVNHHENNSTVSKDEPPPISQHTVTVRTSDSPKLTSDPQIEAFFSEQKTAVSPGPKEYVITDSKDTVTNGTQNKESQLNAAETNSGSESPGLTHSSPQDVSDTDLDDLVGRMTKPALAENKRQLRANLKKLINSKKTQRHASHHGVEAPPLSGDVTFMELSFYNQKSSRLLNETCLYLAKEPNKNIKQALDKVAEEAIKLTNNYKSIHQELLKLLPDNLLLKSGDSDNDAAAYKPLLNLHLETLYDLTKILNAAEGTHIPNAIEITDKNISETEISSSQVVKIFKSKIECGELLCWCLNAMDVIRDLNLSIKCAKTLTIFNRLDDLILKCYQIHLEKSIWYYQLFRRCYAEAQNPGRDEIIEALNGILQNQQPVITGFKGLFLLVNNNGTRCTKQQIVTIIKLNYDICITHFASQNLTMLPEALATLDFAFLYLKHNQSFYFSDPVESATVTSEPYYPINFRENLNFFTRKFELLRIFLQKAGSLCDHQCTPGSEAQQQDQLRKMLTLETVKASIDFSFNCGFMQWIHQQYRQERQTPNSETLKDNQGLLDFLEEEQKASKRLLDNLVSMRKAKAEQLEELQVKLKIAEQTTEQLTQTIEFSERELKTCFKKISVLSQLQTRLAAASDDNDTVTAGTQDICRASPDLSDSDIQAVLLTPEATNQQIIDKLEVIKKQSNDSLNRLSEYLTKLSEERDNRMISERDDRVIFERQRITDEIGIKIADIKKIDEEITDKLTVHQRGKSALDFSRTLHRKQIRKQNKISQLDEEITQSLQSLREKLAKVNEQYKQFKEKLTQEAIQQSEAFCLQLIQELKKEKLKSENKKKNSKAIAAGASSRHTLSDTDDGNAFEQERAAAAEFVKPGDPTQKPAPASVTRKDFNFGQLNELFVRKKNWEGLLSAIKQINADQSKWNARKLLESITLLKNSLKNMDIGHQKNCKMIIEYRLLVIEYTFDVSYKLTENMINCNLFLTSHFRKLDFVTTATAITKEQDVFAAMLIKEWPGKLKEMEDLSSKYLPDIQEQFFLIYQLLEYTEIETQTACEMRECFDFLSAKTTELKQRIQKLSGIQCINFMEFFRKRGDYIKQVHGTVSLKKKTQPVLSMQLIEKAETAERNGRRFVSRIIDELEASTSSYLQLNQEVQAKLIKVKGD